MIEEDMSVEPEKKSIENNEALQFFLPYTFDSEDASCLDVST